MPTIDPFKPPRPVKPVKPTAPPTPGLGQVAPWVLVVALGAYAAWNHFGGRSPASDPVVVAGRAYANALGPAWADALGAQLAAAKDKKTPAEAKDAKDAAFKAASDAAFARLVLPALTTVMPEGPDPDDPTSLAIYSEVVGKLQRGARGQ